MQNTNVKENPVKTTGLQYLLCAVCITMQILFILMFLNGICSVDGTTVSLESFITFIVAILEISYTQVYQTSSYCAQGIIYLVYGILLIKTLIVSFVNLGSSQRRMAGQKEGFSASFKYCIQYVLLASFFNSTRLSVMAEVMIVSGAIAFVLVQCCDYLFAVKRPTLAYIFSEVGYKIIELVICFLSVSLLLNNCIENVWNGFGVLFQSLGNLGEGGLDVPSLIYLLWQYVIRRVMLVVLSFMCFSAVTQTLRLDDELHEAGWKSFMVTAIVILVVDIIIYIALFTQGSELSVLQRAWDYIETVKGGTFSLVVLGIAGVLTDYFPVFKKYAVKKPLPVEQAPALVEGEESATME